MSNLETKILWVKKRNIQNECFLPESDIMMSGNGTTIIFTNLNDGTETYYRANGEHHGDGVSCMTGHKSLPVFAFAELCIRPKIYVLTYPRIELIGALDDPTAGCYITITFSETEHLIALTGVPNYKIQVWLWRTSTLLTTTESEIDVDTKLLRYSPMSPFTICEFSLRTSQLKVYEIHGSYEQSRLIDRRIKIPCSDSDGPFYCCFGIDGMINLVTGQGNVYQISPNSGSAKLIIEWCGDNLKNYDPIISPYRHGIVVAGPDARIKYFKKQSGIWNEVAHIELPNRLVYMRCLYTKDVIYGITDNDSLVKLTPDHERPIDVIKEWEPPIKLFTLLNPIGEIVIAISIFDVIYSLNATGGQIISEMAISSKISSIQEHPIYPVIALGSEDGIIYLLSFYNPESPEIIAEFYVCHNAIIHIKFTETANYIIVSSNREGIFVLTGSLGSQIQITHEIPCEDYCINLNVMIEENILNIYALVSSVNGAIPPNSSATAIKIQIQDNNHFNPVVENLTLPGPYMNVIPMGNGQFYGIPFVSRVLHVLKIENNNFSLAQCFITVHQLKHFEISLVQKEIITWGLDGIVAIYNRETMKMTSAFVAHHRVSGGVKKASIDLFRRHIITIGPSGNLVSSKIMTTQIDDVKLSDLKESIRRPEIKEMFETKIEGFYPHKTGNDRQDDEIVELSSTTSETSVKAKRWTDIRKNYIKQKEKELYAGARDEIYTKIKKLREKLKVLLDNNEVVVDEEKLPIQAFNLDSETTDSLIELARQHRVFQEETMRNFINQQNKITNWIKSNCWNTMVVKGTKIRGISTKLIVENYPLLRSDIEIKTKLKSVVHARAVESILSRDDIFLPWGPHSTKYLETHLLQQPTLSEPPENGFKSTNTRNYAFDGTSAYKFIAPIDVRYDQLEVVTFDQMVLENKMGNYQNLMLREYFNKKFDELSTLKEMEMKSVYEKNARLRIIQDELIILANLRNDDSKIMQREIIDPKYAPDEKVELIVNVEDDEVPVRPYISPSQRKLIEKQQEAAEQRRLALSADDFRDRALDVMMYGVLEIRWEDEIKKNPSKPICLETEKDPKDYDENDLREINEYELKMQHLHEEREKYRQQLEEEQLKLQQLFDTQVLKFNYKIGETLLAKMKVDAAVRQEELKLLRYSLFNFQKIQFARTEEKLKQDIKNTNVQISKLNEILKDVEQNVFDIRNEYESLTTKDRTLDRQFKSNFAETVPRSVVDQVYKLFKKRPRWNVRAWATPTILFDLAKRCILKNSSRNGPPLPDECYDFLLHADQLDNYSHAPNAIDEKVWQVLCQMRRIKMESEFKLKACGLQLAEGEATVNAFSKEIHARKLDVINLDRKYEEVIEKRVEESQNRSVQLVLKRGAVEIELSGHDTDFRNSVLLHVTDVNDINKIIRRAGAKKLKTMQHAAKFRRKIISREWEHRTLRLTVNDLMDFKRTIEKCKITKEVQRWLKYKEKGWLDDISQNALDRGIASTIQSCERILKEQIKIREDLKEKLYLKEKENKLLDRKIQVLNVQVTEQQMARDIVFEAKEEKHQKERMQALTKRARLVRLVQEQHAQILELSTMLELQRLKTFPTLNVISATHEAFR